MLISASGDGSVKAWDPTCSIPDGNGYLASHGRLVASHDMSKSGTAASINVPLGLAYRGSENGIPLLAVALANTYSIFLLDATKALAECAASSLTKDNQSEKDASADEEEVCDIPQRAIIPLPEPACGISFSADGRKLFVLCPSSPFLHAFVENLSAPELTFEPCFDKEVQATINVLSETVTSIGKGLRVLSALALNEHDLPTFEGGGNEGPVAGKGRNGLENKSVVKVSDSPSEGAVGTIALQGMQKRPVKAPNPHLQLDVTRNAAKRVKKT